METNEQAMTEQKPTTVAEAVRLNLPVAQDVTGPATEPAATEPKTAEAEAADKAAEERMLAGYNEIRQDLRELAQAQSTVAAKCAQVLCHAWRLAAPGNVKQFTGILDQCEESVVREINAERVKAGEKPAETWRDLGEAARSYLTYKAHFRAYIGQLKVTFPEGETDFVLLRRRVSAWYLESRKSTPLSPTENAGQGQGTTAAKGGEGENRIGDNAELAVVDTGDGDKVAVTMSFQRAEFKDEAGKTQTLNFPTEVTGALARLAREVKSALMVGVPGERIVAALQAAAEIIGDDEATAPTKGTADRIAATAGKSKRQKPASNKGSRK
jgi:hypothetical protein